MSIKTINASQIREISATGIAYIEQDGSEGFIDFEACYQKYLEQRLSEENLKRYQEVNFISDVDMPARIERIKSWKEVARRNVLGSKDGLGYKEDPQSGKPYLVFYEEPLIAIECDDQTEFSKVQYGIEKLRIWRTFDMT